MRMNPAPSLTPRMLMRATTMIVAMATILILRRRELENVTGVGCEADCERGSQTRIHHQKSHPAVHESDGWTISFAQENVAAARFGISCRQLAVAERAAKRHRSHREPHDQQPHRRAERFRHARRCQKNPDSNDLANDKRRRRPNCPICLLSDPSINPCNLELRSLKSDSRRKLKRPWST